MASNSPSSQKLSPDELKFVARSLLTAHASILLRYDGALLEKEQGAAHLAALQTRALLAEYRKLKKGGGR